METVILEKMKHFLGIDVTLDELVIKDLPFYLLENYQLSLMQMLDDRFVLVESKQSLPYVVTLQKHLNRIREKTNLRVVLFLPKLSPYRRKQFLKKQIAFITEDLQFYLPWGGLLLHESRYHPANERTVFSSAAQLVYLLFLYEKHLSISVSGLATKLAFSPMKASRALRELYDLKLLDMSMKGKTGRIKEYYRIDDPIYFETGVQYLHDPIWKTFYLRTMNEGLKAGLDGLSEISEISPGNQSVRAVSKSVWRAKERDILPEWEEDSVEVQVWRYDPALLSRGPLVDPLSLYASLCQNADERVKKALQEVLSRYPWYVA